MTEFGAKRSFCRPIPQWPECGCAIGGDPEDFKAHVMAFVTAYNFAKHLKALGWRTPYQVICEAWTRNPSIFKIDPHQLIPGPHI